MRHLFEMDITKLKGVGGKRAELFCRLGAPTVGDLLCLYPRDYQDWSRVCSIAEAAQEESAVVCAQVVDAPKATWISGGRLMYRLTVTDGEQDMALTFFNNRFIPQMLRQGGQYLFRGRVTTFGRSGYSMTAPEFTAYGRELELVPVYPATAGLTSRVISAAVKNALDMLKEPIEDPLPQALRERYRLCHIGYAIENIHRPRSGEDLEIARRRLVFEEFLVLQLGLLQIKLGQQRENRHRIPDSFPEEFTGLLRFKLTGAQQRAITQGIADMSGKNVMNRLVQGDVGSGKTAVAAALCWAVIKAGMQAALMAPTEILAGQHYRSLSALLEPAGIRCGLLTGSMGAKAHRELLSDIASGEVKLVIGTHALISGKVEYADLGLVITDEQHRFGVRQRAALAQKGSCPHLLVMSATPIPRTLALLCYGDLDVSVLDELPPGRQKIETYLIDPGKRDRAFGYIKKHLQQGRQAYLVCPLIEEDGSGLMSVESYEQIVRKAFPGVGVGVMHGKLKQAEKDRVMWEFSAGKLGILVATTVVEVGVDVPNATIMLIENAERYGLSQLHQLRGRVGRGEHKSTCILISAGKNPDTLERLMLFKSTGDGFKIAEADLKMRGPGDFFGQRQHGLPQLKIAGLSLDLRVLDEARSCARQLFYEKEIEGEEYGLLREEVGRLFAGAGPA